MKILVTGGLGFIGRALAETLLGAGHQVDVGTRGRADDPPSGAGLIRADVRDLRGTADMIKSGAYDAICHLAALTHGRDSIADPVTYWDVNLGGTLNVLRALADSAPRVPAPRLILASTNIVYGSRDGALSEDLPARPESPYAASKAAAERLVQDVAATGTIRGTVLRVFNAAGAANGRPDLDTSRLIPNVMRAARGELQALSVNGDGSARRDYTHVLDVAEAFRLAVENDATPFAIYNVGSGVGTSVADVIAAAEAITGRHIVVDRQPPKSEPHTSISDPSRIKAELGWLPQHSNLETILRTAWDALA